MACSGHHCLLSKSSAAFPFLNERSVSITGLLNRMHSISNPVKTCFPRMHAVVSNHVVTDLTVSNRIVTDENDFYDQTIEKWIEGSVTEIVKNITQAPLLLQIYANGDVKTEKVKSRIWPNVNTERSTSPDGIILVEELDEDEKLDIEGGTKAFGVLIQGKMKGRDECKSACYLLKTTSSSVNSGDLGLICSHYCLMKVKNFTESASSQLNDCWLVK